jgi:uncharacterized repeat protein (TIGR02543 family)
MAYEHGLYDKNGTKRNLMAQSNWATVPNVTPTVNAFDNDPNLRPLQDLGYDGYDNAEENTFFSNYLTNLQNTLNPAAYAEAQKDPSSDNFVFYLNSDNINQGKNIIGLYKNYNNPENNTPVSSTTVPQSSYTTPDNEDLNRDNTLNENEAYFQYRVGLFPGMNEQNHPYIVSTQVSQLANPDPSGAKATWYQFRIPIKQYDHKVGEIGDFRNIQFIRMFLTNFSDSVILRFTEMDFIRNQWRKYEGSIQGPTDYLPQDNNDNEFFNIGGVGLEENASKVPVNYLTPPNILREVGVNSTANPIQLNEQALRMNFCNLKDGDAKASFKNLQFDFRQFKKIKMFFHAEQSTVPNEILEDNEISAFLRLGSDFKENYYEYEIPLKVTPAGNYVDASKVWPDSNQMIITLEDLVNAKYKRNGQRYPVNTPFVDHLPTRNITVVVREFVPEIEPVLSFNNVELKANSDGSFTIYKPLGSNTLTASISAKIKNYESPLASTFTGGAGVTTLYNDGSTLRYLLDTRVTYSGPLSSVTPLVTKLGIELGSGSTTTKTVASQTSPAVNYTSYTNTGAERSIDLVALRDVETYNSSTGIFAAMATISSTTFPGIHTYTVQIGGLTRAFIFRVVEPTPLIITRDNVVEYGATSGTASKDNVTFKEEDNKYYVNGVNGTLKINVLPFGMPTGEYPYTFTKRTPSGSFQSSTNLVTLTIKTSPAYDGSLTFPGSGAGSEMAVNEVLTEEGEYVYTFNINNLLKEIRVIVLAAPQLKVESVTINSLPVTEFNNIYYVNHSTSTRYSEFNLTPVNIETTYKYVLNNTGAFPTGSSLTSALQELVIVDGKMTVGVTLPARTSATVAETHTYLIALYKGSVQIGAVTKVVITSQPVYSTIFFNSNGGTVVASKTQFVATAVSAPTPPTRTDFDFTSWHVKPDLTDTAINFSAYFTPENDAILFAKWSQFTITYNLDGGVNYASAPTVFASTSATITLGTPTKGSSTFVGWFTAASGGSQVTTIPSGSSANVTVFARWS